MALWLPGTISIMLPVNRNEWKMRGINETRLPNEKRKYAQAFVKHLNTPSTKLGSK
jgi:hypothetical protein